MSLGDSTGHKHLNESLSENYEMKNTNDENSHLK